jgi:F0F1-type ATP synthase membrane subunit c/vacuolar-type H+-ATPase subunit K
VHVREAGNKTCFPDVLGSGLFFAIAILSCAGADGIRAGAVAGTVSVVDEEQPLLLLLGRDFT